jgi:CubicO group peptidase (beta-lactamase class C family)
MYFNSGEHPRVMHGMRSAPGTEERWRRIEEEFPAVGSASAVPMTLSRLMEIYRVPGLSLAVIEDFRLTIAKSYGKAQAGTDAPMTPRTLLQAGSVSKPVAASGLLRLVDDGRISLDTDVNEVLRSWKVPQNQFTKAEPVTLRRLLTHMAGMSVHFFPGHLTDGPVPSLQQVLDGIAPANTAPIRVVQVPGQRWRYSGGGYLVAQQLAMDISGRSFPSMMADRVFEPLRLEDSTFEQPLPPGRSGAAASGTQANGETVPGHWHVYPEMAAAGLWTTAGDLAQFTVRVVLARRGEDDRWLSQSSAQLMTSPQAGPTTEFMFGDEEAPDMMGLGFVVGGGGRAELFGHLGDDAGFQALVQMSTASGQGVAILANSDLGLVVGEILRAQVYRILGWKTLDQRSRADGIRLTQWLTTVQTRGVDAARTEYLVVRSGSSAPASRYRETLLLLGYTLAYQGRVREAVAILRLCAEENPDHWNAHDSLGEILALAGAREEAIASFRRSVELNPDNSNGKAKLRELGATA